MNPSNTPSTETADEDYAKVANIEKKVQLKANKFEKKPKWINVEEGFEKSTTETEWHLVNYQIMNEEELC